MAKTKEKASKVIAISRKTVTPGKQPKPAKPVFGQQSQFAGDGKKTGNPRGGE
jgi:hypothetical protein